MAGIDAGGHQQGRDPRHGAAEHVDAVTVDRWGRPR